MEPIYHSGLEIPLISLINGVILIIGFYYLGKKLQKIFKIDLVIKEVSVIDYQNILIAVIFTSIIFYPICLFFEISSHILKFFSYGVYIFGVFNISRCANNPPPIQYIDINRLKQIAYSKQEQSSIIQPVFEKLQNDIKRFNMEYLNTYGYLTDVLLPKLGINKAVDDITYSKMTEDGSTYKNDKTIKVKLISNQPAIIAGLEFAKHTFKLIDNKIKFTIKKKEGSIVKKNDFDVVTAFQIFEHMVAPFNVLSNIKTNKLIASVPLSLWFSKAYRNNKDKWDRHYHEFEDWQFDWLLEKSGWKIKDHVKFVNPVKKIGIRPIFRKFTPRFYLVYAERK